MPTYALPPSTPSVSSIEVAVPPAIRHVGEEVLRMVAAPVEVDAIRTPECQQLIATMIDAMRAAPGVGLAAPQIGVSKQIFVVEDRAEYIARLSPEQQRERRRQALPLRVVINPVVEPVISAGTAIFREACLSVPGMSAEVERALEVRVTGLDERGQVFTWQVHGWAARIIQHEHDHLLGTLYIDRMNRESLQHTTPSETESPDNARRDE